MKFMGKSKAILATILMAAVLLTSSSAVFAAGNKSTAIPKEKSSARVGMSESNVKQSGIQPNTTVTNPATGASASINWMDSYSGVSWSVHPTTLFLLWTFSGYISEIYYNSNGNIVAVDGAPVVGSSGVITVMRSGNASYVEVTLTGTATDILGNTSSVLPGCEVIHFY